MKKFELKPFDKKVYHGKKLWRLYINGKTDNAIYWKPKDVFERYEFAHDDLLKKIGNFPCTALPTNLDLLVEETWELKFADFSYPILTKKGAKLELTFTYLIDNNEMLLLSLNPMKLRKLIISNLQKQGLKLRFKENMIPQWDDLKSTSFVYTTDCKGTIKSKIDSFITLIKEAENDAEKKLVAEIKKYISKNKL